MRRRTLVRRRAVPRKKFTALSDFNVVDAPAFTGDATVSSHPPAQYNIDNAPVREIHHRGVDKSARIAGPRLPTSQGIATATIDRAVVTAEDKRAAGSKDVLKSQPVIIADLQHPTIEPILKVEVVAEGTCAAPPSQIDKMLGERSCLSLIVAGSSTKTAFGSVSAGGVGTPELDVTHVVLDQPVWQRSWRHAIEELQEKYEGSALPVYPITSVLCLCRDDPR